MLNLELNSLILEIAVRHGLPPALVKAIVEVESGGNPKSARYEPDFYTRYVRDIPDEELSKPRDCSRATERTLRAMSIGLMQTMGQVAREMGHDGDLLDLTDPATSIEIGCRLLAKLRRAHFGAHGWAGVVRAYNTGRAKPTEAGDIYAAKVLAALGGEWPA